MDSVDEIELGRRVFAKVKGWSPWPAWVQRKYIRDSKISYMVVFYGKQRDVAWCARKDLFPYDKFKQVLSNKKIKSKDFQFALKAIEGDTDGILSDSEFDHLPQEPFKKVRSGKKYSNSQTVKVQSNAKDSGKQKKLGANQNENSIGAQADDSKNQNPNPKTFSVVNQEIFLKTLNILSKVMNVETEFLQLEAILKNAVQDGKIFNYEAALSALQRLSELNLSYLILIKYPDILSTLHKISTCSNYLFAVDDSSLEMFHLLKERAKELLQMLKNMCKFSGDECSEQEYRNLIKQFQRDSNNLTREEYVFVMNYPVRNSESQEHYINNTDHSVLMRRELLEYYKRLA